MTEPGVVATLGVFDGVHLGHQSLVRKAQQIAAGRPVLALTFDPHPQAVVGNGAPSSLATLESRLDLLREAGATDVGVVTFDPAVAAMTPEQFVADVLVGTHRVTDIVIGENFRFGARASGDIATLRALGSKYGIRVHAEPLISDGEERWSSTRIRDLILEGEVQEAARGLGRPYRVDGTVVRGAGRGRTLGYPTANVQWIAGMTIPAEGVYAGWVRLDDQRWPAAISIGRNPQFDGVTQTLEAYVIDQDSLDLYDRSLGVEFVARLRGQQRFADVAGLVAQMDEDVSAARRLLLPS